MRSLQTTAGKRTFRGGTPEKREVVTGVQVVPGRALKEIQHYKIKTILYHIVS